MRGYPLVFRCYAERHGDQWLAYCIDLTLAVQGDSFQDVRQRLDEQIVSYVYDAIAGEDQQHAAYLLTRKAPLRLRYRYYVLASLQRIHALRDSLQERIGKTFEAALNARSLVQHTC